jgi:hypothetical protein
MKALRFVLCALLLAPLAAAGEAGRVLIAVGEVLAERGTERIALTRGSALEAGDTIRTGAASNAQIRMSDGAIVSLRERTVLRIDEHVWSGRVDGTERSFLSLLAGGIRTVTGAIGNLRREDRYGVRTPTASIGIRGTHYTLRECNEQSPCPVRGARADLELAAVPGTASDTGPLAQVAPGGEFAPPGTYGGVSDGRIGVRNDSAPEPYEFGAREFFYVADRLSPPQGLIAPPPFLYDRLIGRTRTAGQAGAETGETIVQGGIQAESRPSEVPSAPRVGDFVVSEQRDASGAPAVVPAAVSGPTIAGVGAHFDSVAGGPGHGGGFLTAAEAVLQGSGSSAILTAFAVKPGSSAEPGGGSFGVSGSAPAASVINETVPNPLGANWGRWTAGSISEFDATPTAVAFSTNNQFHYLFGPLTPPEVIAAKTGTSNMWMAGGTTPTNNLGETGAFFISTPQVNFTGKTFSAAGFGFTFTSQSWFFGPTTTPIQILTGKGAFIEASVGGGSCFGSCSGAASLGMTGIFMGPQGDHLGIGFSAVTSGGQHASTVKLFACSPSC